MNMGKTILGVLDLICVFGLLFYLSNPYEFYSLVLGFRTFGLILLGLPLLVTILSWIMAKFDRTSSLLRRGEKLMKMKFFQVMVLLISSLCLLILYGTHPYYSYQILYVLGILFLIMIPLVWFSPYLGNSLRIHRYGLTKWIVVAAVSLLLIISTLALLSNLHQPSIERYRHNDLVLEKQGARISILGGSSSVISFDISALTTGYGKLQSEYYIGSYLFATRLVNIFKYQGDPIQISALPNGWEIRTSLISKTLGFLPVITTHRAYLVIEILQDSIGSMNLNLAILPESGYDGEINRIHWVIESTEEEKFYGAGIQYSNLVLNGHKYPIWVSEQGHGRGEFPVTPLVNLFAFPAAGTETQSYAPMPVIYSDYNRSLFINTTTYSEFDLTRSGKVAIEVWDDHISSSLSYNKGIKELVAEFSTSQGIMPELPEWMGDGAIVRTRGGGSDAIRELINLYEDHHVNLTGIWIEDWAGIRQTEIGTRLLWNWVPSAELYPDWEDLVKELRGKGIHVLIYYNSFLTEPRDDGQVTRNLYREAVENNYFVKTRSGSDYIIEAGGFPAGLLDFSNPSTVSWMQKLMQEQLDLGVSGWMADFAEYIPTDAVVFSGVDAVDYHNRYPVDWASVNSAAISNHTHSNETFFFMRSAYLGSQGKVPSMWLGDQLVDWSREDGLKSALLGLVNSGLAGLPQVHMDIGGYFSIVNPLLTITRTEELLKRWMELAVFSVAFRSHEGNQPNNNLQVWDDKVINHFAKMTDLFMALDFYRNQLITEYQDTGVPIIRPMAMEFQSECMRLDIPYQFMYGSDLLVRPVVDEGQTTVRIYLPQGTWVNLWDHEEIFSNGDWVKVSAPVGQPAMFYPINSPIGFQLSQNLEIS